MHQIEVNLKEDGTLSDYSVTCFALYKLRKQLLHQYSRISCRNAYEQCKHRKAPVDDTKTANPPCKESFHDWCHCAVQKHSAAEQTAEQTAEQMPDHKTRTPRNPTAGAASATSGGIDDRGSADAIERCIRNLARVLRMKTHPDRAHHMFDPEWFGDVQCAMVNKELWVLTGFLSKIDTSITEIPLACLSHIFREITIVCCYLNRIQSDPNFVRFSDPQWWRL